ncbi:MAG: fluoride efflux transporter CrcB [Pseudomonadales bacterium]|jgi:CrcB protein
MTNWALIAIGGALGALLRHGLTLLIPRGGEEAFPWATLIANMIGCLLMGCAYAMAQREILVEPWRGLVMVGLLGALTTFSAFSQQMYELIQAGRLGLSISYALMSVVSCLLLFAVTVWALSWVFKN